MNSSTLSDKSLRDLLRDEYLQALTSYKSSHSEIALDRLDVAKDAYVLFKAEHNIDLK
jgi:hypothetical protein